MTELAYKRGDWKKVPILECKEPLVEVPPEMCYPYYALEMNLSEDSRVFLRKTTLDLFLRARELCKEYGFDLVVYDGWRSVAIQEKLFWLYLKEFTAPDLGLESAFSLAHSALEIQKVFQELDSAAQTKLKDRHQNYVSWPSDDLHKPSPHSTGGSVDVWLFKDGAPCDFGVPFDWMEDEAHAFFHIKNPDYFTEEVSFHRSLMIYAMSKVGFACLPYEFWHFDYGNQMHSLVSGDKAIYTYATPE